MQRSGAFNVSLRELLSRYVALEEYYLDETVSMAVRIDEVVSGTDVVRMTGDNSLINSTAAGWARWGSDWWFTAPGRQDIQAVRAPRP